MKRNQPDSETADDHDVKQRKVDKASYGGSALTSEDEGAAILEPFMADLDAIQMEMQQLDEQCAKEQMSIQKQYDEKKKPVLEKRQKILDKIPGFWCRALRHHPALAYTVEEDIPALQLLQRIELDDNLDDHGSYRIRFTFLPEIKEYFSPETIEKEVCFSPEVEQEVKVTPIEWVKGKNIVEIARKKREENEEKAGSEDDTDQPWSVFEWFSKENSEYRIDIGEVIRREIWHQPVGYFMDRAIEEEDDDDDFDDDEQVEDDEGREEEIEEEDGDEGDDADGDGDAEGEGDGDDGEEE